MIEMRVRVFGARETVFKLTKLSQSLGSVWGDYWNKIEEFLTQRVEQSFATQGAASGAGPWVPLSPKYAAWKQQHFPGRGILVATGEMKSSIVDAGHPLALRRRRLNTFIFGSRDPKVQRHHEGTEFLPARPILILSQSDLDAMGKEAGQFVVQQIAAAGFGEETFLRRGRPITIVRGPLGRFV